MKEILEVLIKNLVDDETKVQINEKQEENQTIYEVKVAQEDMGKVIGKQGKVAK